MNDVQILGGVCAVCAGTAGGGMAAVIHCKAHKGVMLGPGLLDQRADGSKHLGVGA